MKNSTLIVKINTNKLKDCVRYFGVHLNQNLPYQKEVKTKNGNWYRIICSLQHRKTKILLLNSLVISHPTYSSVPLNEFAQNLITTLGKQLIWAIRASLNRIYNLKKQTVTTLELYTKFNKNDLFRNQNH